MSFRHLALPSIVFASAAILAGCVHSTTLLTIKADGSGTIENRTLMTSAALAQMRQLSALFGGADGRPFDPLSEQQALELAERMGEGVALVSTRPLSTGDAEGREAVYAFTDVGKLRLSGRSAAPGSPSPGTGRVDFGAESDAVSLSLTRTPGGTSRLTLRLARNGLAGIVDRVGGGLRGSPQGSELTLLRQMLAGLHVALRVQPSGRLVRTSSPYVDGQTVTIFDVDLDPLLADPAALARLQNARTPADAVDALKTAPGIKLTFDPEVTIEFAD